MTTTRAEIIDEQNDIKAIKGSLQKNHLKAKQQLEVLLAKWPNSVALKRLNHIYFSSIPVNPVVTQSIAYQNQFSNRYRLFREAVKAKKIAPAFVELKSTQVTEKSALSQSEASKKKTIPAMFMEFNKLQAPKNHSAQRKEICKPTGEDMIFETKLKK